MSPSGVAFASDAYDDCIADLDEQVGKLIDTLDRRGVLEQTWLIVVSDHGESFGEHSKIFCHGTSLFDTEVRSTATHHPTFQDGGAQGIGHSRPRQSARHGRHDCRYGQASQQTRLSRAIPLQGSGESHPPGRASSSPRVYPNLCRTTPRTVITGVCPRLSHQSLHSRIRSGLTCAGKSKSANSSTISPKTPVNCATWPRIPPSRTRSAGCVRALRHGLKALYSQDGSPPDREFEPAGQAAAAIDSQTHRRNPRGNWSIAAVWHGCSTASALCFAV